MKRPDRLNLLVQTLTLLSFSLLSSCGEVKRPLPIPEVPAKNLETITNPDGSMTVLECHPSDCESGKYCLVTLQKKVITEARCVPLPADCSECGCLKEDGLKQFKPEVKCTSSSTFCANTDGNFTVSCEKR